MVFQLNMAGNTTQGVCSTSIENCSSSNADVNAVEECICCFCHFRSCSRTTLVCHIREEHGTYVFATCKTCHQFFPSDEISNHVLRCKGAYACSFCRSTFAHSSYLQRHIARKHSTPVRPRCDICNRSFSSNHSLTIHKRSHEGHMPHLCKICNMQFVQKQHLQLHLDSHHAYVELTKQQKPYPCSKCGRCFLYASSLQHHKRQHNPELLKRVHCCQYCGKAFAFRSELERHAATHLAQKSTFKCIHCPRQFTRSNSLSVHLLRHTNPSLFTCHYCDRTYASRTYLLSHMAKHQSTEESEAQCSSIVMNCLPSDLEAGSLSDDCLIDQDMNDVLLDEAWNPVDFVKSKQDLAYSPNVNLLHSILYDGDNSNSGVTASTSVN